MWPSGWAFPNFSGSNSLQKRLVKFLLRRTVGQFLKENEINLEDLDVQLGNGHFELRNVALNEDALTDLMSDIPIVIHGGRIGKIHIKIPWSKLWTGHCEVVAEDISITASLVGPIGSNSAGGIAESIVTDGAASLLASSVYIADDFLRRESLGYGRRDDVLLSKDVERMVADINEERYKRKMGSKVRGNSGSKSPRRPSSPESNVSSEGGGVIYPRPDADGKIAGLQVVSEMVDRILSGINFRVSKVNLWLRLETENDSTTTSPNDLAPSSSCIFDGPRLKLQVNEIAYEDDPGERRSLEPNRSSMDSPGVSMETKYQTINFKTLHKKFRVRGVGLRYYKQIPNSDDENELDGGELLFSTFDAPITTKIQIHRQQPFTEVAAYQKISRSNEGGDSIYVGAMPGEFRDRNSKGPENDQFASDSALNEKGIGSIVSDEPSANGWDVKIAISECALVINQKYVQALSKVIGDFQEFYKEKAETAQIKTNYRANLYRNISQKGRWSGAVDSNLFRQTISMDVESVFVAIIAPNQIPVDQDSHSRIDYWENASSIADLKSGLDSIKFLYAHLGELKLKTTSKSRALESRSNNRELDDDISNVRDSSNIIFIIGSISLREHDPNVDKDIEIELITFDPLLSDGEASPKSTSGYQFHYSVDPKGQSSKVKISPLSMSLDMELIQRISVYGEYFGMLRKQQEAGEQQDPSQSMSIGEATLAKRVIPFVVESSLARIWITLPGIQTTGDSNSQIAGEQRDSLPSDTKQLCLDIHRLALTNIVNGTPGSSENSFGFPFEQTRTPRIQDLLGSRDNSFCKGFRIEYDVADLYLQVLHPKEKLIRIATICEQTGSPSCDEVPKAFIMKPHLEITTTPNNGRKISSRENVRGEEESPGNTHMPKLEIGTRPPAFDVFDYIDDDARIRRTYEMDATLATEFEQNSICKSNLMLSCHFPEVVVQITKQSFNRAQYILNQLFLWQAAQPNDSESSSKQDSNGNNASLFASILVDISQITVTLSNEELSGALYQCNEHVLSLNDSRLFITNSGVDKGWAYISFEAEEAQLQNPWVAGDYVPGTVFSSTLNNFSAEDSRPSNTPQVSVHFLSAPTLQDVSDMVVQLAWTTFDLENASKWAKAMSKFFTSSAESDLLPSPPPKQLKICVNMRNTSAVYRPSKPSLPETALVIDTFLFMTKINVPDEEKADPLRYSFEQISVMGRGIQANSSLNSARMHWDTTTRKFWESKGFVSLLHTDILDITTSIYESENGLSLDLHLNCEKSAVDMCADSRETLVQVLQTMSHELGTRTPFSRGSNPSLQESESDGSVRMPNRNDNMHNILDDIEEDAFGASPIVSSHGDSYSRRGSSLTRKRRGSRHSYRAGSNPDLNDDSGGLTFVDDYISANVPDIATEYEVVSNPNDPIPKITSPSYSSDRAKKSKNPKGHSKTSSQTIKSNLTLQVGSDDFLDTEISLQREKKLHTQIIPSSASPNEPLLKAGMDAKSPDSNHDNSHDSAGALPNLIEDYFESDNGNIDGSPSGDHDRILRVILNVRKLVLNLYGGSDWGLSSSNAVPQPPKSYMTPSNRHRSSDSIAQSLRSRRSFHGRRNDSTTDIFDISDGEDNDSVFIQYGSHDYAASKRHSRTHSHKAHVNYYENDGGSTRSRESQIICQAQYVSVVLELFSESSPVAFSSLVEVGTFEIIDNLESSEWNKFLTRQKPSKERGVVGIPAFTRATQYSPKSSGKQWSDQSEDSFAVIRVESVRPYPSFATTELRADLGIAPIRCYIDQDALEFVISFFSILDPLSQPPTPTGPSNKRNVSWKEPITYFQAVHISPLELRFDYKPKSLNFSKVREGNMAELINMFPIEDADMTLNAAYIRGAEGPQKLVRKLIDLWLPHITRTQVPGLVSGLAPLRSLVNMGSGMADLVFLPINQYKKDGRLIKGIQRGAKSFARSAALGVLDIGSRVAINAQNILEQAGDIIDADISGDGGDMLPGYDRYRGGAGLVENMEHLNIHGWRSGPEGTLDYYDTNEWPEDVAVDLIDFPDTVSVLSSGPSVDNGKGISISRSSRVGGGSISGVTDKTGVAGGSSAPGFLSSKYARQPLTANQGVKQAYQTLSSRFNRTRQTILAIPVEIRQNMNQQRSGGTAGRSAAHSSVRAVVRAIPVAILNPAIGAAEATSKTLLGIRNSLDNTHREQLQDKYKRRH
ncbi:autophagy- protein 2 [Mycoemilia scoparia]|uniref:Autophagy-related protein 2 n=1 Tax=Mycoemilia scoparia TaxID=417184 RepID=A0A9W8DMX0_9FUNG|nr:autophagy- protein 2 [Mycoemilia scoparia]